MSEDEFPQVIVHRMFGGENQTEARRALPRDMQARVLKDHLDTFKPLDLRVGLLVEQRKEFGIYNRPLDNCLAIIVDVFEAPVHQGGDTSGPYFRNDCTIMIIDPMGCALFSIDSRFFKKYEGPVA